MRGFKPVPVKGYENYLISRKGEIYSICAGRVVSASRSQNIKGYIRVQLYKNGSRRWFFVHRMVAKVYKKNPDPKRKTQVNHDDFDLNNNNASNLFWVTPGENMAHSWKRRNLTKEEAGTPF